MAITRVSSKNQFVVNQHMRFHDSFRITNLVNGIDPQDAVTVSQLQNMQQGLDFKESVKLATTAELPANTRKENTLTATANGELYVDGIKATLGIRILVKNELDKINNGVYFVSNAGSATTPYVLKRSKDADRSSVVSAGMFMFVEEGNVNGDSAWVLMTNGPVKLNTTELEFVQFSGGGQIIAGNGLTKTGNTIYLTYDSIALEAGTGISLSATSATLGGSPITITNAGVTSITGTANQVIASASTGAVTLSLPQSIATTSSVVFGQMTVGSLAGVGIRVVGANSSGLLGTIALKTSEISEGNNLYYTDNRARLAISASAPISYNNSTGIISHKTSNASAGTYNSVTVDTYGHVQAASNVAYLTTAVTSISIENLVPLFTTDVLNPTTNAEIQFNLDNQIANTVFAGSPTNGVIAKPTFRALVPSDLPISATTPISYNNGVITHALSGVIADVYNSVVVDEFGHVIHGVYIDYLTSFTETDPIANAKTLTINAGAGISIAQTSTQALGTNPSWTIASTITQYTDAMARNAISLTTIGTGGAATYNSGSGVLNIPIYVTPPAGNNTEVQFNDNGIFGARPNFTFDKTINQATITGNLVVDENEILNNAGVSSISGSTTLTINDSNYKAGSVLAGVYATGKFVVGGSNVVPNSVIVAAQFSHLILDSTSSSAMTFSPAPQGDGRMISAHAVMVTQTPSTTGSVSKVAGIHIQSPYQASSTAVINIIDYYQLYINRVDERIANASTISNRWGIYQEGENDKNYFGGTMKLAHYGEGNHVETPSYLLGVDASGNVVEYNVAATAFQQSTVFNEPPASGPFTTNHTNDTFTMAATPLAGKLQVFVNGILMNPGLANDYVQTGAAVVFNLGAIPEANATILFTYMR